jgi:hypothetical protein
MNHGKRTGAMLVAVAVVAGAAALFPQRAEAHGRHGFRGPVISVGAFYGFGPSWGYGYGPYWGPFYSPFAYGYYGRSTRADLNAAGIAGVGGVDFKIKPDNAEVWVDGKFVAEARELDGDPSYLWLQEGSHQITLYKGGYERYEKELDVRRGTLRQLKVHLEKGEARPPKAQPESKEST